MHVCWGARLSTYRGAVFVAIPSVEAIDTAKTDNMLNFSESHTCYRMVHIVVVFWKLKKLSTGIEQVIFGEQSPQLAQGQPSLGSVCQGGMRGCRRSMGSFDCQP